MWMPSETQLGEYIWSCLDFCLWIIHLGTGGNNEPGMWEERAAHLNLTKCSELHRANVYGRAGLMTGSVDF